MSSSTAFAMTKAFDAGVARCQVLDAKAFDQAYMHSHRQITDLYLLCLAVKNRGRLISFHIRIPLTAVRGATQAHLVTL